jgi:hypothetical protein
MRQYITASATSILAISDGNGALIHDFILAISDGNGALIHDFAIVLHAD